MPQLVTRLPDDLVAEVDRLVAEGIVASRSDAVRAGLVKLIDDHRRREIGRQIAEGYERQPQTEDELAGADEAALAMILEEPW